MQNKNENKLILQSNQCEVVFKNFGIRLPDVLKLKETISITHHLERALESDILVCGAPPENDKKEIFIGKIKQILDAGVICISDYEFCLEDNKKVIKIDRPKLLWAHCCSSIFSSPEKNIKFIAVTGTNGKTSTVFYLGLIADTLNLVYATIGTLGVYVNGRKFKDIGYTSPPPYLLFSILRDLLDEGVNLVFIEASSHALEQDRFGPIQFDHLGWTSFSHDHLDYHKTLKEYALAKRRGVTHFLKKGGSVWIESRTEQQLKLSFGHDFLPKSSDYSINTYDVSEDIIMPKSTPHFLRQNATCAFYLLQTFLKEEKSPLPLQTATILRNAPGRMQQVVLANGVDLPVFIDYAHTPDALENLLSQAESFYIGKKIILIFGCGGNRDKEKRPLMAKVAERYASLVFVTSDNPRWEKPNDIISQVLSGFSDDFKLSSVKVNIDRKQAISQGINQIDNHSILLIAGKGHETGMEIQGEIFPFDDYETARDLWNSNKT